MSDSRVAEAEARVERANAVFNRAATAVEDAKRALSLALAAASRDARGQS